MSDITLVSGGNVTNPNARGQLLRRARNIATIIGIAITTFGFTATYLAHHNQATITTTATTYRAVIAAASLIPLPSAIGGLGLGITAAAVLPRKYRGTRRAYAGLIIICLSLSLTASLLGDASRTPSVATWASSVGIPNLALPNTRDATTTPLNGTITTTQNGKPVTITYKKTYTTTTLTIKPATPR